MSDGVEAVSRLDYLRTKLGERRDLIAESRRAERDRYPDAIRAAIAANPELSHPGSNAIHRSAFDHVLNSVASYCVGQWQNYGGQAVPPELSSFIEESIRVLLETADLSSGEWDVRLESGSILRPSSIEDHIDVQVRATLGSIRDLAVERFTYAQHDGWDITLLEEFLLSALVSRAEQVRQNVIDFEEHLRARSSLESWQELNPHPPRLQYGASPEGAESWCSEWLSHIGLVGAEVTRYSGDGGIDVVSPTHIAQVKHYTGSVSIAEVREFVGVAYVDGRLPIFMTSGQYPMDAVAFSDAAGLALFHYDVVSCTVTPHNSIAGAIARSGLLQHTPIGEPQ